MNPTLPSNRLVHNGLSSRTLHVHIVYSNVLRLVGCFTQFTLTLGAFTASLHESMPLWTSIRRVGVEADAQERSTLPPRDDDEDRTDLDKHGFPDDFCQGTPAHEQDARDSDKDKHARSEMELLHGATSLVSTFGTGWLGSQVFDVLYKQVANKPVYLDKTSVIAVTTFKRAFCKMQSNGKYVWNRNLSDNLEQLAEVRRHFAKHHETLSDNAAWRCLWKWIYNFRFTAKQRELRKGKQRSKFEQILDRELGCRQRTLKVIKLGTAGLADNIIAEGGKVVLDRFIDYICRIEATVGERMQRGQDLNNRQRTSRHDASERVHPPCDKKMKPKSRGSPSIPTHVPEQHAQGKGKGAKDKQESVGRGCKDVRKTSWKGPGDADAAKRKRRGREGNDKRSEGRAQKGHYREFFPLTGEDLEADRTKHARKRAL